MRQLSTRRAYPRSLFEDFDQLVNQFFTPMETTGSGIAQWQPRVDVREKENYYMISADLPGLTKDDITIDLKDGVLSLSGERKLQEEKEEEGLRRTECFYGKFERHFQMPAKLDASKIEAHHENGVLEILIPKAEVVNTQSIPVQTGKGGLFSRILGTKDEGKH